jgi:hypothetical protein
MLCLHVLALYRQEIYRQLNVPRTMSGFLTIWNIVGDPLLEMWSDYKIPVYHYSKNFLSIQIRDMGKKKTPCFLGKP